MADLVEQQGLWADASMRQKGLKKGQRIDLPPLITYKRPWEDQRRAKPKKEAVTDAGQIASKFKEMMGG